MSLIGQRKHVRPIRGKIRDPGNKGAPLPDGGRVVVIDEFWSRRIADGDVDVNDPPPKKPTTTNKTGTAGEER